MCKMHMDGEILREMREYSNDEIRKYYNYFIRDFEIEEANTLIKDKFRRTIMMWHHKLRHMLEEYRKTIVKYYLLLGSRKLI